MVANRGLVRIAAIVRETVDLAPAVDITAARRGLVRIAAIVRETVGPAPAVDTTAVSLARIVITVREIVDRAIRQLLSRRLPGAFHGRTRAQT